VVPNGEITLAAVFEAFRRVPSVTDADIDAALTAAGVPLAVEMISQRRDNVHDEAQVRDALRHHVNQCFRNFFSDALYSSWAQQVSPSVMVRTLRGLQKGRKKRTEILDLILGRERHREGAHSSLREDDGQVAKVAAVYESRKVSPGHGGARHEANRACAAGVLK
jgi:hypothetical protein